MSSKVARLRKRTNLGRYLSPITNQGNDNADNANRSPTSGSSTNPDSNGPRTHPTTLTAYALPARLPLPRENLSTMAGVMNPTNPENGMIPNAARKTDGSGSRGSAVRKLT